MKIISRGLSVLFWGYLVFLLILAMPRFTGISCFAVTSGSMEPKIPTGSAVYVTERAFEDIKKGDVITFTLNHTDTVVTHRVWDVEKGSRSFKTKGDANEQPDAGEVSYENVLGVVCFSVPGLGYPAFLAGSWMGKVILGAILVWLLAMHAIVSDVLAMKKREEEMIFEQEIHRAGSGGSGCGADIYVFGRSDRRLYDPTDRKTFQPDHTGQCGSGAYRASVVGRKRAGNGSF